MKNVDVYRYKSYDVSVFESALSETWATLEAIDALPFRAIALIETVKHVPESALDKEGFLVINCDELYSQLLAAGLTDHPVGESHSAKRPEPTIKPSRRLRAVPSAPKLGNGSPVLEMAQQADDQAGAPFLSMFATDNAASDLDGTQLP
jgi:hypothetical protein